MSTTRHRRRTWQRATSQAAFGVLAGADAVWTIHATHLRVLGTLAFGVAAAALVAFAVAEAVSIAWHRGRHRYLVYAAAFTPLRRPLHPIRSDGQDPPDIEAGLHYANIADHWRTDAPAAPLPAATTGAAL